MKAISVKFVGGIALILAPLLRLLSMFLHPDEGADAATYAAATAEPGWGIAHVVLVAFALLLALGFICLFAALRKEDRSALPLAGIFLMMGWAVPRFLGSASDGFAAPLIAQRYLSSAGAAREAWGAYLMGNLDVALGTNAVGMVLFAGGLALLSAAMLRAGLYNRFLAGTGVVLGLLYAAGYPLGMFGAYGETDAWFYYQVATMVWSLALGVVMLVTKPETRTEPAARSSVQASAEA
ncbi:MAG: hypothetical protein R3248_09825 [Candidatus Promineifilaceae bacterium]|nr:hypothetical protein [Candidatus Promineifilaceae bacterium]